MATDFELNPLHHRQSSSLYDMLSRIHRNLFPILFLSSAVLAQTSTVIVIPTPLLYQDAQHLCGSGDRTIYPIPATPTDPVYEVLKSRPEDRFWIRRRGGTTCTCLNKNLGGDMLDEAPCGELLPVFCKDCSHGGDGCQRD